VLVYPLRNLKSIPEKGRPERQEDKLRSQIAEEVMSETV
jgi:hypothetical protein